MTSRIITALCLATALLAAGTTHAAEVPQGLNDGIKVHGHWKINILEPDGTLVSSYEFENAFYGQVHVVNYLARRNTVGAWVVMLRNNLGTGPCTDGVTNHDCWIAEPFADDTGAFVFKTLTVGGASSLVLSGTATAAYDGAIEVVETWVDECAPTVAPSSNCNGAGYNFTFASLGTSPPTVLAGQIIQVTVTISFS